jgi:hypothetical protein
MYREEVCMEVESLLKNHITITWRDGNTSGKGLNVIIQQHVGLQNTNPRDHSQKEIITSKRMITRMMIMTTIEPSTVPY